MRRQSRLGQSMVEMAMIAPILLTILVTVIDFGWAAYDYATLAAAVREGARVAIHTGATRAANSDVFTAVSQNAFGLTLGPAPCPNGQTGSPLTPAPTTGNTGYLYVIGGPNNTVTNAPPGQPASSASGSCAGATPSYAGHYQISVVAAYRFSPIGPFAQQFFSGGIVMTVTSTMSTEY